jgi:hypothetical protein
MNAVSGFLKIPDESDSQNFTNPQTDIFLGRNDFGKGLKINFIEFNNTNCTSADDD